MRPTDAPPTTFLVRSAGTWTLTPLPAAEPIATGLDQLRSLVAARPEPHPPADPERLGALAGVEPVWAWVGRVHDGAVVVAPHGGTAGALDLDDLVLLDRIAGPVDVGVLVEAGVVADAGSRLLRLVDLGVLQPAEVAVAATAPAAPIAAEPPLPAPIARAAGGVTARLATAYRLSSKLAPVRRALDRGGRHRPPLPATPVAPTPEAPAVEAAPVAPAPAGAAAVHPDDGPRAGRVPVYSIWHPDVGPLLSLGMLTAAARAHRGGALTAAYQLRRPETAEAFLADLATHRGPAILLCSDYVWSLEENLATARRALELCPDLLVVHGGPSAPTYAADVDRFLVDHGTAAAILVRGEGEVTLCRLLDAIAPTELGGALAVDHAVLADLPGLAFRVDGCTVTTDDPERIADLDALPSPYLSGEFDHIGPGEWNWCLTVETTRGCPYGCTFCDWGSSTLSRIRKFSVDRVEAEIAWAATRRIESIMVADANFGILRRDVDTAERIAAIRRRTGFPTLLAVTPAKNTIRHLTRIMDTIMDAGIAPTLSISLQTVDPGTLEAIDRSNISIDSYLALAADHRRRGLPLLGDVLVGMPGQSRDTYRADLQFHLDHEIMPRTWPVQLLPNSPMNEPSYRERHGIEVDEHQVVVATSTFDRADRDAMFRLRRAYVILEVFGVLRHVARWLQWDHGLPATALMERVLEATTDEPERFPHLAWLLGYFDLHPTVPVGWDLLYGEVRSLLVDDLGIPPSTALDTVLAVQAHLMPRVGRTFPDRLPLAHDYPAYFREGTESLYTTGRAGRPATTLAEHGPGELTVDSDPLDLCRVGPRLAGDSRDEVLQGDFYLASTSAYELYSPLTRVLPHVAGRLPRRDVERLVEPYAEAIERHLAIEPERPALRIRRRPDPAQLDRDPAAPLTR